MKHIYLLLLACITFSIAQAQIVNIPDANFKNALVNTVSADFNGDLALDGDVDINDDGEIQLTEAQAVIRLKVDDQNISSLEGIEYFLNLENLECRSNILTNLNLESNVNLKLLNSGGNNLISLNLNNNINLLSLSCYGNQLTNLSIQNCVLLSTLLCNNNQLTNLDLSGNINLESLDCRYNQLTNIDLSQNIVSTLDINNNQLINMILKSRYDLGMNIGFDDNPDLEYICASDNQNYSVQNALNYYGYTDVILNSYCSFVPGGDNYSIEGGIKLDLNNNGCDIADSPYPNFKFNTSNTNGNITGVYIPNNSGQYVISVQEGIYTITPILENLDYFLVSPESLTVDFQTDINLFNQDFCITPNGEKDDLEIAILPLELARPGFDADYKIIYKNKGNTTLSGTLELNYYENIGLMDFVSATPVIDSNIANVLTWSYSNLQPFETREIFVAFNLNTPTENPPLNGGDPLGFEVDIYPKTTDETPSDNHLGLKQIVVNSLDPNDKTCLQGETITPEQVGKYVHYMIRFENTGTASAVNIVVKDEIDMDKYDVSTLIPLYASNDFVTNIKDDNIVEFIFEDINLPFDDANNDGYVVFKIETLETLVLGNSFANDAEIYFDYNAPIITNNEETTIGENLSVEETTMQNFVTLYPNPVNNVLNINSKNTLEAVSIYDVNGRQLQSISLTGNKLSTEIKTSGLSQGIYFVKIKTDVGMQTTKIIKK